MRRTEERETREIKKNDRDRIKRKVFWLKIKQRIEKYKKDKTKQRKTESNENNSRKKKRKRDGKEERKA